MVICFLLSPYNGKEELGLEGTGMRKKGSRWVVPLLAVFVLGWGFYLIMGGVSLQKGKQDASYLLYQVSLYQMQLLSVSIGEVSKLKDTGQLNALKQAAYSAQYTHERLALAMGKNNLKELQSLQQLLQYILGLQMTGTRGIKADEMKTLQEAGAGLKNITENYGKLLNSAHQVLPSQNEKLEKVDKALVEALKKKQLGL